MVTLVVRGNGDWFTEINFMAPVIKNSIGGTRAKRKNPWQLLDGYCRGLPLFDGVRQGGSEVSPATDSVHQEIIPWNMKYP